MTTITNEDIDVVFDATTMIEIACELLSDGDVSDITANNISWMLSSVGRRLSSVVGTIERVKVEHEKAASVVIAAKPGENAS